MLPSSSRVFPILPTCQSGELKPHTSIIITSNSTFCNSERYQYSGFSDDEAVRLAVKHTKITSFYHVG